MARAPSLLWLLALTPLLAACRGEQVELAAPADASGDSAAQLDSGTESGAESGSESGSDSGADADRCAPIAGNLVPNPSFELTNTAGLLTGWLADPIDGLVQRTGGAAHCDHWAEVTMPAAGASAFYWGQTFNVDTAPPKGAKVLVTAWVRTLDGQNAGLLLLTGTPYSDSAVSAFTLPADGSWRQVAVEWTAPREGDTQFFVNIGTTVEKPRTLGIDQVAFVVQP